MASALTLTSHQPSQMSRPLLAQLAPRRGFSWLCWAWCLRANNSVFPQRTFPGAYARFWTAQPLWSFCLSWKLTYQGREKSIIGPRLSGISCSYTIANHLRFSQFQVVTRQSWWRSGSWNPRYGHQFWSGPRVGASSLSTKCHLSCLQHG